MTSAQKIITELWDEIEARAEVALMDISTEHLFAHVEEEASVMLRRKVGEAEVTRALEAREQRRCRGAS